MKKTIESSCLHSFCKNETCKSGHCGQDRNATAVTMATSLVVNRNVLRRKARFAWKLARRVARTALAQGLNVPAARQRARRALVAAGF